MNQRIMKFLMAIAFVKKIQETIRTVDQMIIKRKLKLEKKKHKS